jgi:tetratricopeptide (TPR) repeat protein
MHALRPTSRFIAASAGLVILFFLGIGLSSQSSTALADIIAPDPTARLGPQSPGIPDSLAAELSADIAAQLNEPVKQFLSNRNVLALRESYDRIRKNTDTLPAMEIFLGKLLAAYNLLADSLSVLEQYTNQSPEDPEAYIAMGNVALKSGRVVDAWLHLQHSQRLIDQNRLPEGRQPLVIPLLLELQATVAERRKNWSEAEKLFLQLAERKPELGFPLWRAGRVRVMAGEIESAKPLLEKAFEKDPRLPSAPLTIAQTLHDTTNWIEDDTLSGEVEKWYQRAAEENPEFASGWASYFKWLLLSDRPEDVAKQYETIGESLKTDRELLLMRGLAARYLNDLETAETILSTAHQASPQDIEIADQLALVLIESTDEAKRGRALQLAERNLRQLPQAEVTVATAAWIQLRLGAIDIADQLLTQLAARGNLTPQTAFYVAELMERSGQTQESQRLLKIAVESTGIFPQRDQARKRLGG